jgi:hypothetical protein
MLTDPVATASSQKQYQNGKRGTDGETPEITVIFLPSFTELVAPEAPESFVSVMILRCFHFT